MYVILKIMKNKKTKKNQVVLILNSDNEVWEFDTETEAQRISDIFSTNSDSGHTYLVKKIC